MDKRYSKRESSSYDVMHYLRIQHKGGLYRALYAFDPRRVALLLVGGDKTGDDRWNECYVPTADRLYDEHLIAIKKED
jgi:hypothetical protein